MSTLKKERPKRGISIHYSQKAACILLSRKILLKFQSPYFRLSGLITEKQIHIKKDVTAKVRVGNVRHFVI